MAAQFDASGFTTSKAKPLPVVLLLDTSGSMYGDKINSLNDAVRKMLATFRKEESQASEFLVSIITFGGTAVPGLLASRRVGTRVHRPVR